MRSVIERIRGSLGNVGRGTLIAISWQFYRAVGNLLWVVVVARFLGPEDYGLLSGVWGMAATVGTLTGLGQGLAMLVDVPRNTDSFGDAWGRALVSCIASGACLVVIFIAVAPWMIPAGTPTIILVAIGASEILCFPLIVLASYAFQAHEKMGWASAMYAMFQTTTLLAAFTYSITASRPALESYAVLHLMTCALACALTIWMVRSRLHPPPGRLRWVRAEFRRGFELSFVRTTDTALSSLDKTLVLRLGGEEMAGIYAATTRLATALAMPVVTLSSAALPSLSRQAPLATERNPLIRKLLLASIACGLIATIGMGLLSGLLPVFLGEDFAASSLLGLKMALLPALMGMSAMGCAILLATGSHRARVIVQLTGLVVLFVASSRLIPGHGVDGAVLSVLGTLTLTVAGLWTIVASRSRRHITN